MMDDDAHPRLLLSAAGRPSESTPAAADGCRSAGPAGPDPSPPSFEEFYAAVWPRSLRLAGMLLQDAEAGEDVAQDVLARIYSSWGTADNPEAYLQTSLVNACANWHRRHRRHRAKLPLLAVDDRVDFAARELVDALARLPFRQRAVLVLRYHLSLSEREIADALGCRPGTVKSLASRGLTQLRKDLKA